MLEGGYMKRPRRTPTFFWAVMTYDSGPHYVGRQPSSLRPERASATTQFIFLGGAKVYYEAGTS